MGTYVGTIPPVPKNYVPRVGLMTPDIWETFALAPQPQPQQQTPTTLTKTPNNLSEVHNYSLSYARPLRGDGAQYSGHVTIIGVRNSKVSTLLGDRHMIICDLHGE